MAMLDTLMNLVKQASAALDGPVIPAVLDIGKSVIELVDEVKGTINQNDAVILGELRDTLEAKVLGHADTTEDKLRG
jgi:hypothetical protein